MTSPLTGKKHSWCAIETGAQLLSNRQWRNGLLSSILIDWWLSELSIRFCFLFINLVPAIKWKWFTGHDHSSFLIDYLFIVLLMSDWLLSLDKAAILFQLLYSIQWKIFSSSLFAICDIQGPTDFLKKKSFKNLNWILYNNENVKRNRNRRIDQSKTPECFSDRIHFTWFLYLLFGSIGTRGYGYR